MRLLEWIRHHFHFSSGSRWWVTACPAGGKPKRLKGKAGGAGILRGVSNALAYSWASGRLHACVEPCSYPESNAHAEGRPKAWKLSRLADPKTLLE